MRKELTDAGLLFIGSRCVRKMKGFRFSEKAYKELLLVKRMSLPTTSESSFRMMSGVAKWLLEHAYGVLFAL